MGVLAYELMMQGETPFYHEEPSETEKLILRVRLFVAGQPGCGLQSLAGHAEGQVSWRPGA